MKGDWKVKNIYMNGGSLNMMELALPHYKEGNGIYYCYFYDEGIAKGEYFTLDTLNYEVFGQWEIRKNKVYILNDKEHFSACHFSKQIKSANSR